MDKKGLGEPLAIVMSIILIFVVFVIGFLLFSVFREKTTTKITTDLKESDNYLAWLEKDRDQDMLFSILNIKTEYDDLSTLIASKDKEKIDVELKKIQDEIKKKTGRDYLFEIWYPGVGEKPLGDNNKINVAGASIPDINGDKVVIILFEQK
ncbi:hypothetical protein HY498_00185 [Candidatus Woesearchaeota archaeon]|nr:hypothetical protein [Candidatus Woesearchaeota archaeon]